MSGNIAEDHETRMRRLRMRSWRRGMKEMDLILGHFADHHLVTLQGRDLDLYEALLEENDQDLYLWITRRDHGEHDGPEALTGLLDRIADVALNGLRNAADH